MSITKPTSIKLADCMGIGPIAGLIVVPYVTSFGSYRSVSKSITRDAIGPTFISLTKISLHATSMDVKSYCLWHVGAEAVLATDDIICLNRPYRQGIYTKFSPDFYYHKFQYSFSIKFAIKFSFTHVSTEFIHVTLYWSVCSQARSIIKSFKSDLEINEN